LAYFLIKSNL